MSVTAEDLARAISYLPRQRQYHYVNERTRTVLMIVDVELPEGPIYIKRYDPGKGETASAANVDTISRNMIWRIANALSAGGPINFDRVLGGSYNTRSAFEALLAHCPEFYTCQPGRIEVRASTTEVKKGHKHLVWRPDMPHEQGVVSTVDTDVIISEVPSQDVVYEALTLPSAVPPLDIEAQRRHAQIQIALLEIGLQLGFRVWIAQNDRGIEYAGRRLGEIPGVVAVLYDEPLLASFGEAVQAALFIDCIWFRNTRFMPAVMEIEHSTGVTSGLSRMQSFHDALPEFPKRWVIVAPDEDRNRVVVEANKPQFRSLGALYFPYTAVEELYSLGQRRRLRGVSDEFLDNFMEPCISS